MFRVGSGNGMKIFGQAWICNAGRLHGNKSGYLVNLD